MKYFLLFGCALLFASCNSELDVPASSLDPIFGKWEKFRAFDNWGTDTLYTIQGEYDMSIEKDGRMINFKDGIPPAEFHFTFEKANYGYYEPGYYLHFRGNDQEDLAIYYLSDDTLALTPYGWTDVPVTFYVKVK